MPALAPEVADLLNQQINAEAYAAQLYYSASSWADAQGFEGLAAWALGEAQDEQAHQRLFLEYANQRGAPTLAAIAEPAQGWSDYSAVLSSLLTAEEAVWANLSALDAAADAAGDSATCLIATKQVLGEQVPAVHRLQQALLVIARGAPIDLLDRELWEDA